MCRAWCLPASPCAPSPLSSPHTACATTITSHPVSCMWLCRALLPRWQQQIAVGIGGTLAFLRLGDGSQTEFGDVSNNDPITSSPMINQIDSEVMFQACGIDDCVVWHLTYKGYKGGTSCNIPCSTVGNSTDPYTISAYRCAYSAGSKVCGDPKTVSDPAQQSVPGGWPQPTSRAQRDELHAAITALHTALFGAEATAANLAQPFPDHLPFTLAAAGLPGGVLEEEGMSILRVSRLARAIPTAALHAIVTPSGYRRKGDDLMGTYPSGSITSRPGDQNSIFTHYQPQDGADALFEINTGSHVVDGESLGLPGYKFQDARSSPTIDNTGTVCESAGNRASPRVPAHFELRASSGRA